MSKTIKNPSPLVSAVLSLDEHFTNLKRLSSRIDEIDMRSDFDLKSAEQLIGYFAESGQALTDNINNFIGVLSESRAQAELAAQKVAAKADQLLFRKNEVQEKMAQFQTLNEKVSQLNETLLKFKRPSGETLSEQDQVDLKTGLASVAGMLKGLIDEAETFQNIGRESKIKVLQQNADSMRQSLISVSQKLEGMITLQ